MVILLHEAGHFEFGDAGQYGDPVAINKDTLPVQLDEGKNKELRADRFAGDQIRSASKSSGQRQTAAMDMSLCLMNAGWNLLGAQIDRELWRRYAASILCIRRLQLLPPESGAPPVSHQLRCLT